MKSLAVVEAGHFTTHVSLIVANCLIIGVAVLAAAIYAFDPDFYYLSVQEDQYLEWATFWAFVGAGSIYLLMGWRLNRTAESSWFALLVGAFCLLVALEEISWGQRIVGYQPPEYFLESNYQLELNLHNAISTDIRRLGLMATILGFGIALPLLVRVSRWKRLTSPALAASPPLGLAPAFLTTYIFYQVYPWHGSAEWVELMLGLGFLLAAQRSLAGAKSTNAGEQPLHGTGRVLVPWLIVIAAGVASTVITNSHWLDNAHRSVAVQREVEALASDFRANSDDLPCNVYKRIYTYAQEHEQSFPPDGHFADLVNQGLPENRAKFMLDPWNSPYWIRDTCASAGRKRSALIYSLGPNRRRDSSQVEIRGDDVGAYVFHHHPTR